MGRRKERIIIRILYHRPIIRRQNLVEKHQKLRNILHADFTYPYSNYDHKILNIPLGVFR